jgi:hypothetical protein
VHLGHLVTAPSTSCGHFVPSAAAPAQVAIAEAAPGVAPERAAHLLGPSASAGHLVPAAAAPAAAEEAAQAAGHLLTPSTSLGHPVPASKKGKTLSYKHEGCGLIAVPVLIGVKKLLPDKGCLVLAEKGCLVVMQKV